MKKVLIGIALAGLCCTVARASYDPGSSINPGGPDPTFTLYDNHAPPAGLGSYVENGISSRYTLDLDSIDPNLLVNNGDVILLENGTSESTANWSDVLTFSDNHIATLTSYDGSDAATFWGSYTPSANAVYIQETGGQYTVYAPVGPVGVSPNIYDIDSVAVPEPTTVLAGALLLLPLGASALRILRKNRIS